MSSYIVGIYKKKLVIIMVLSLHMALWVTKLEWINEIVSFL